MDNIYFKTNIKLANEVDVLEVDKLKEEEKEKNKEPIDADKKMEEEKQKLGDNKKIKDEEKEELTPEGSYDENDISIYYDFTDEDTIKTDNFFLHMKEMCRQKVIFS